MPPKKPKKKNKEEKAPVTPKVGVGLVLTKNTGGKRHVLMGRRRGAHSSGDFAFPGGHFEFGESTEDVVRRELAEECGEDLAFSHLKLVRVSNVRAFVKQGKRRKKGKHYLDLVFHAEWSSGEPENMEPKKCEGWVWVPINEMPEPISPFSEGVFRSLQNGKLFSLRELQRVHEC